MRYLLLFLLVTGCSGCFRRFVRTPAQLREYFSQQKISPLFVTLRQDTVQLFCAVAGADTLPPLLVVHGAPGAWYGNRNLLTDSLVTSRFQVISVDRPGYGQSWVNQRHGAVTSIATQSSVIRRALLLNKSHHPGIVLGSSYGGPIAAQLALDTPAAFYRVILLAAAADPAIEKFWWFNKYVHHGPLRWLLPRYLRTATDEKYAHAAQLRLLLPQWQRLAMPVFAVQGDADKIVYPANLDFLQKVLTGRGSRIIRVPGAGHLIRMERPALVRDLLLEKESE